MNISPVETPFISNAGKGTATQTNHEWQTDALEAAAANAQIEGNDYTLDTRAATVRLSNYCQISGKAVGVSGTDEVVKNAGRGDELAYYFWYALNSVNCWNTLTSKTRAISTQAI